MSVKCRFRAKTHFKSVWEMFPGVKMIQEKYIYKYSHREACRSWWLFRIIVCYSIVWKVMLAFTRARAVMDDDGMSCGSKLTFSEARRTYPLTGDLRKYLTVV